MRIRRSTQVEIRSKLKDAILSELASSNRSMPISPNLIQLRLQQFFPTFHAPIHPPYSSMIQQAILKLNEEFGSSEEAISRFLEKEYEGLPWAHASFLSHHLKKLSRNGEIICVNNERYMLNGNDCGLGDEEESHSLNISNRDEKEDQTLVQGKRREVEAVDGWSGVNGYHAEESGDRCEVERQRVHVNDQNKACEQRIEGFEEQKGRRQSINEVKEESQNFSGQIEVVEEFDVAKEKLAEVSQEQRGEKRKRPEKTKQQIKVLEDDIPQPMMEEGKKYVEERQQQIEGGSGVMKSVGEQKQPQRGEIICEQGHSEDQKIDIRTKMVVFPCDVEDGKNLKTSLLECSMHLLEEEKKEALEHEGLQQRELHQRNRDSIIVCALPAQQLSQSRTNIYEKAHKLHTDSISAFLESKESGQMLLQQLKICSPQRPADLQVFTYERFTQSEQKPVKFYTRRGTQNSQPKVKTSFDMSKNLEQHDEKQEQQFQKPKKLLECEIKTKEANFGGQQAAVSLSIEVKDSMNVPLDLGQHGKEHQKKLIKVYGRRNMSNFQLKGSENSNILPTSSELLQRNSNRRFNLSLNTNYQGFLPENVDYL